jgi:glutamate carboxypeptidase
MDAAGPELLAWLRDREGEMAALLEELARAESPTHDRQAQRAPFEILSGALESAGLRVRAVRGRELGDALFALPRRRMRHAPYQLLLGHMDTVWPVGTLATMPVHQADGCLYGPGVYDMKGGLVQLVFALRALAAHGLVAPVTPAVLLNADEETGSRESRRYVILLARGAARALVLEPGYGPSGRLKTGRKGVGRFQIVVTGRAAHAGSEPEEGVSAILELSHQIQRLHALNDLGRGVTVNVGMVDGGLRPNVVAPRASALVDVRVVTEEDAVAIEREIRELGPVTAGTTLEVVGGIGRRPMEATPRNRALFALAERIAAGLGLEIAEATRVGGGSDANHTSPYTATLDGLGAVGDGAHAADEHVVVARMPERAALLALLVLAPASLEWPSRAAELQAAATGPEESSSSSAATSSSPIWSNRSYQ